MLNNWIKGTNEDINLAKSNIEIDVHIANTEFEILLDYDVVIISSDSLRTSRIKESLGKFTNHFEKIKIIDLGYFIKEDYSFNYQLIQELYISNITTIILDKDFIWFSAIANSLAKNYSDFKNICFSNKIHFTEFGIPCDYLGFQRHMVTKDNLYRIADHSIDSLSLGKLRAEINVLEPILRDAKNVYFDLSTIKISDCPGSYNSLPSGLTCEETCQIFKFLGNSQSLVNLVIGGDFEADDTTSDSIAEAIWYFLEGKNNMITDHPSSNTSYQEFIVEANSLNDTFTFVKNNETGRWWFKLPSEDKDKDEFVSISLEEYQETTHDNLPDRLLKHLTKI